MGGHTLKKLLIREIIDSCRYSVQALLQAWQGLDIIDKAGFHKHNAHSGYLVPGFGHCFAYIKWPAYSSVLTHFLTHFTCTSFCYSFVPCQQIFYCTVFIGVALLGMCCRGCSPRVPLQFSALGPISATAAFTLAFFPRLFDWAALSNCTEHFGLCVFLVPLLYKVKVDAISLTLECCIIVVLYSFLSDFFAAICLNKIYSCSFVTRKKKFMHVI